MIHPTGLATHGLDVRQFLDFLEYRPDEEKWELIDGYALMMAPPTFGHQRISGNLWRALNDRLELAKPEWLAHFEVGIELPEYSRYRPAPDLMVVDAQSDPRRRYADRFYLVAEVLSDSDSPRVLAAKLAYYQDHAFNTTILLIEQDQMSVRLFARQGAQWLERHLSAPSDMLDIDGIGRVCTLAALYRGALAKPAS